MGILSWGEAELYTAREAGRECLCRELYRRLRDECLNENWFISLKHARDIIESWRIDYNEDRPHGSLGGLTPNEFVENTGKTLIAIGL